MLCNTYHDNLYGDWNRQFGSESVVELLYDEHNHHDNQRNHYVAHIAAGNLCEYALKGLHQGKRKIFQRPTLTL